MTSVCQCNEERVEEESVRAFWGDSATEECEMKASWWQQLPLFFCFFNYYFLSEAEVEAASAQVH